MSGHPNLEFFSFACGITYVSLWAVSTWAMVYETWKLKTYKIKQFKFIFRAEAIKLDFLYLTFTGYLLYSIFVTFGYYYSEEY